MKVERIRFYPYRDGTNLTPVIEAISKPAEFKLTEDEKLRVLYFERILTNSNDLNTDLGQLTSDKAVVGLSHIYKKRVNNSVFYLDYFVNKLQKDRESTDEIARKRVLGADYSQITSQEASRLERESAEFVQDRTVADFEKSNFESVEEIPNPTRLVVVRNPKTLVEKVNDLRNLKKYIKAAESSINRDDNESRAKQLMLRIHRRRVNELIAGLYPDARSFAAQAHESNRVEDILMLTQLSSTMKQLVSLDEDSQRIASRIDKFANGAGELVNGNYTQQSREAADLADQVGKHETKKQYEDYEFKEINKSKLKDKKVSAENLKVWLDKYFDKLGVLSTNDDYDPDRAGAAVDDKWQVVIHPKNTTFSVDTQQKAVKIPPKFSRGIADINPAGGVPVMDHESIHVIQSENRSHLGLAITEEVKMDRGGTLAEGGGLRIESITQAKLFGQERPVNPDYLRAIQAKLAGGTYVDCFKAFYDSRMKNNPESDKKEVANLAANRVLRNFRNGGDPRSDKPYVSNSSQLEYLEQELVARQIAYTPLESVFYYSGVNLELLVELHKFGMVDLSKTWKPSLPSEILYGEIVEFINQ